MTLAFALAAVVAVFAFTLATGQSAKDSDMYWHLASGRWMVEHRALLDRDVFSETVPGAAYTSGQWLAQLALYAAYALAGWQGIAALRGALVGIATFFAASAALLVQPRPLPAMLALLPALAVSVTIWTDRPQLWSLALFSVFLFLLLRAHREGRARELWLLPPLAALWANLHGGYALGLGLAALFLLAAVLERRPHARTLALALAVAAALALANPTAFSAYGAARYASGPTRFIQEELPPDVFMPAGAVVAALLLLALACALVGGVPAAGGTPWLWAVILPPLLWLGLAAQRNLPFAALALADYVAVSAPLAASRLAPRAALAPPRRLRTRPTVAAALAGSLVLAAGGAVASAPSLPDETSYPRGALPSLGQSSGPVLNEYDWGGYLIWHAPERGVFIDGRGYTLYGPDVYADYFDAVGLAPRYGEVLARRDIRVALLKPSRPLAVYLRETGWRVRSEEPGRYVLLVRP